MRWLRILFWLAMTCLALPACSRSNEIAERGQISAEVHRALAAKDFDALETLATRYREEKLRTASGLWKLTIYHYAIDDFFDKRRRDEGYWNDMEHLAQEWVAAFPGSPAAHLTVARVMVNRAWSIRGTGYANTVAEDSWQPFYEHVERSRSYLAAHKAVGMTDPGWYDEMAQIAAIQQWPEEDFTRMLEEGLEKEPGFYQLYFTAMNYYAPKWGGSAASIERFARESVERTRATDGWGLYARIYWYASQSQYGDNLFRLSDVNWNDMKKGMDDVLAQYADDWNIGHFAKFACLAGDKAKTAELLDQLDLTMAFRIWERNTDYEACLRLAQG